MMSTAPSLKSCGSSALVMTLRSMQFIVPNTETEACDSAPCFSSPNARSCTATSCIFSWHRRISLTSSRYLVVTQYKPRLGRASCKRSSASLRFRRMQNSSQSTLRSDLSRWYSAARSRAARSCDSGVAVIATLTERAFSAIVLTVFPLQANLSGPQAGGEGGGGGGDGRGGCHLLLAGLPFGLLQSWGSYSRCAGPPSATSLESGDTQRTSRSGRLVR